MLGDWWARDSLCRCVGACMWKHDCVRVCGFLRASMGHKVRTPGLIQRWSYIATERSVIERSAFACSVDGRCAAAGISSLLIPWEATGVGGRTRHVAGPSLVSSPRSIADDALLGSVSIPGNSSCLRMHTCMCVRAHFALLSSCLPLSVPCSSLSLR